MLKVIKGQNEHKIEGRLEVLVAMIIENAKEIALPLNAQIIFDCAGGKVSATIKHQMGETRPEA